MYKKANSSVIKHWDFILFDLIALAVIYTFICLARFSFDVPEDKASVFIRSGIILLILYLLVAIISNAYKSILQRDKWTEMFRVFVQVAVTFVLFVLYNYVTKQTEFSRLVYGATALTSFVIIWCYRVVWKDILRKWLKKNNRLPQLLIITDEAYAANYVTTIKRKQYNNYRVKGVVVYDKDLKGEVIEGTPVLSNRKELLKYLLDDVVDEIFIALDDDKMERQVISYCLELGVTVHIGVAGDERIYPNAFIEKLGNNMVITTSNMITDAWKLLIKRLIDIIGGCVGCLIMLVMAIFIAPQIKAKDPGPVFFAQTRIGKNGRKFKLYKFRSMYTDAEERKAELMQQNELSGPMFKMQNDPRILPGIGTRIRESSMDEWPQFWNVLKGDMSLVGTRPPTVEEFALYEAHHKQRLSFKPGITGLWQVSGRSQITDFEEVVKLDNAYIRSWSLGLDAKILIKTIKVVMEKRGSM